MPDLAGASNDCSLGHPRSGARRTARAARRDAFETAYRQLEGRVRTFLALPLETMRSDEITLAAQDIHNNENHFPEKNASG